MFIQNKYTRWYYKIIRRAEARELLTGYVERHHIIPKSLGGSNQKSNIISLTAREHFICHWLLTKMVEGRSRYKMRWALHKLSFCRNNKPSYRCSRYYEIARLEHSRNMRTDFHPNKRESNKQKISSSNKKHWKNNTLRRKQQSDSMTEKWTTDYDYMKVQALLNLQKATKSGKDHFKSKELEYKGKIYYGYRELKDQTGVSKHLYHKYYLKGIDPELRIGKNGSPSKEQQKQLTEGESL